MEWFVITKINIFFYFISINFIEKYLPAPQLFYI